eukprot:11892746-Alexandrium_andersonii.AAC.1
MIVVVCRHRHDDMGLYIMTVMVGCKNRLKLGPRALSRGPSYAMVRAKSANMATRTSAELPRAPFCVA